MLIASKSNLRSMAQPDLLKHSAIVFRLIRGAKILQRQTRSEI
ncbi:unnamed protein product [Amoebophrya sp. A25]|nr:unnamed protein product [Amoebophrya sp. A25]|eukprot:GSA25T00018989001.1